MEGVEGWKGSKVQRANGFTLIEVLIVMAILGVLAAIVFHTVTGLKTVGEGAAGMSDAKEVENALISFNAQSRTQDFPEGLVSCTQSVGYYTMTVNGKAVTVGDPNSMVSDTLRDQMALDSSCGGSGAIASHTQINWAAQALVRQNDGTLETLSFIPDFLTSKPKSANWVRGSDSSAPDEFIWLLLKGTPSDSQGRTLQVLRLKAAGTAYEVIRK